MKTVAAALTLVVCSAAQAADGAGYVPAHTTRDGTRVPPNVSTISGQAQPTRLGAKTRVASVAGSVASSNAYQLPLFVNARPLR